MNSAFHHVALAELRPGMVLSDVLLDRQGQMLLPGGAILTASIIALLPRHGIERVSIVRDSADGEAAPPIDEAAVTARLARLFRRADPADPQASASVALHRYIADYRLDREIPV
jgi:hypothetical protein